MLTKDFSRFYPPSPLYYAEIKENSNKMAIDSLFPASPTLFRFDRQNNRGRRTIGDGGSKCQNFHLNVLTFLRSAFCVLRSGFLTHHPLYF